MFSKPQTVEGPDSARHGSASGQQKLVDEYFHSSAGYWRAIYEDDRLVPLIYRERRQATLRWVEELGLPTGARVLEVGCGAGLTSVALAQRGLAVEAIDSTQTMTDLTRREAETAGLAGRLNARVGDVHNIEFASESFDLVMAVGVIPWLHSPSRGVDEMARVLRPGGYLLLTADNRARLNWLLDPRSSPVLAPLRIAIKHLLHVLRLRRVQAGQLQVRNHYPWQIDRLIAASGLQKIKSMTLGFGPFSFFGKDLLPDSAGVRLHRELQRLADGGVAGARWTGSHYLLLARKPVTSDK